MKNGGIKEQNIREKLEESPEEEEVIRRGGKGRRERRRGREEGTREKGRMER